MSYREVEVNNTTVLTYKFDKTFFKQYYHQHRQILEQANEAIEVVDDIYIDCFIKIKENKGLIIDFFISHYDEEDIDTIPSQKHYMYSMTLDYDENRNLDSLAEELFPIVREEIYAYAVVMINDELIYAQWLEEVASKEYQEEQDQVRERQEVYYERLDRAEARQGESVESESLEKQRTEVRHTRKENKYDRLEKIETRSKEENVIVEGYDSTGTSQLPKKVTKRKENSIVDKYS